VATRKTTAHDLLREARLRVTPARESVLRELLARREPRSHDEIVSALAPGAMNRSTVYRTLIALAEAGLVTREDLGDWKWKFRLASRAERESGPPRVAQQFFCTRCARASELGGVQVVLRPGAPGRAPRSVERCDVSVQVRGVCDVCDNLATKVAPGARADTSPVRDA
jgi:Fe2+ or Zn2+ uptake regulation protein